MKKLILGLALLSFLCIGVAKADVTSPLIDALNGTLKSLPATEGVIYCVREHQFKDLSSITVVSFQHPKWAWLKLNGDVGYAVNDMYALEAMYPLGNLSQFNVKIPVLSQIDISVGYGYGWLFNDNSRQRDGGPCLTGTYKF